jgi:hypothetical protein
VVQTPAYQEQSPEFKLWQHTHTHTHKHTRLPHHSAIKLEIRKDIPPEKLKNFNNRNYIASKKILMTHHYSTYRTLLK